MFSEILTFRFFGKFLRFGIKKVQIQNFQFHDFTGHGKSNIFNWQVGANNVPLRIDDFLFTLQNIYNDDSNIKNNDKNIFIIYKNRI